MKSRLFHFLALAVAVLAIALQFGAVVQMNNAIHVKIRYFNFPKDQRGDMEIEAAKFRERGQNLAIIGWVAFVTTIALLIASKLRGETETPVFVVLLLVVFILIQMVRA